MNISFFAVSPASGTLRLLEPIASPFVSILKKLQLISINQLQAFNIFKVFRVSGD
jgi:hypothetical protein